MVSTKENAQVDLESPILLSFHQIWNTLKLSFPFKKRKSDDDIIGFPTELSALGVWFPALWEATPYFKVGAGSSLRGGGEFEWGSKIPMYA